MSFGMFVTWVLVGALVGVLAGLVLKRGGYGLKKDVTLGLAGSIGLCWIFRATGIVPDAGMVTMAFLAVVGAAGVIVAQRMLIATELPGNDQRAAWRWGSGAVLGAAVIWMMLAPSPPPAAIAAVIGDKTYAVTPGTMKVRAGIVTAEVSDLKVTERIEQGSGRVATAAKLTARLVLKNTAANQTVRLVSGKLQYVDARGQVIKLEDARTEPVLRFGSSSERLDPGQETTESWRWSSPARR